jgi:hypothetical protein
MLTKVGNFFKKVYATSPKDVVDGIRSIDININTTPLKNAGNSLLDASPRKVVNSVTDGISNVKERLVLVGTAFKMARELSRPHKDVETQEAEVIQYDTREIVKS